MCLFLQYICAPKVPKLLNFRVGLYRLTENYTTSIQSILIDLVEIKIRLQLDQLF